MAMTDEQPDGPTVAFLAPDPGAYESFHAFIKACIARAAAQGITQKGLATLMGVKPPSINDYKDPSPDARRPSPGTLIKLADGLGLTAEQRVDLAALIARDKQRRTAKSASTALSHDDHALERAERLSRAQVDYIASWKAQVLRELARLEDHEASVEGFQSELLDFVATREIEEALELLVTLGYMAQDGSGAYRLMGAGEGAKTTRFDIPPDARAQASRRFHEQMCEVASKRLHDVPREERYYQAVIGAIPTSCAQAFQDRMNALINEFRAEAAVPAPSPERTYALITYLFPLTRVRSGGGR